MIHRSLPRTPPTPPSIAGAAAVWGIEARGQDNIAHLVLDTPSGVSALRACTGKVHGHFMISRHPGGIEDLRLRHPLMRLLLCWECEKTTRKKP